MAMPGLKILKELWAHQYGSEADAFFKAARLAALQRDLCSLLTHMKQNPQNTAGLKSDTKQNLHDFLAALHTLAKKADQQGLAINVVAD